MRFLFKNPPRSRASALAIILAIVTLITVLVVTFLSVARFERTDSGLALGRVQAESLSDFAADTAITKLREAIAAGTYISGTNTKTWASMPGRIAVFDLTLPRSTAPTFYDIFSGTAGPDDVHTPDLNNVDLNKPSIQGEYPIATPSTAQPGANMKVGWINVLADSGTTASSANPIVGRIAYWMDDETCKVNINTADGSHKTDLNPDGSVADGSVTPPGINPDGSTGTVVTPVTIPPSDPNTGATGTFARSYGFGTPSEISLAALPVTTSGGAISGTGIAAAIAAYASGSNSTSNTTATITGFNSAAEVGRAAGVPSKYYVTNKFNITHTSRSPDLNMFGEPRIALMPVFPSASGTMTYSVLLNTTWNNHNTNGNSVSTSISGPINFVYPLSEQLPRMSVPTPAATAVLGSTVTLPQYSGTRPGGGNNLSFTGGQLAFALRIANYLNGVNSQGQSITWPDYGTLNGSHLNGSTAFSAKYNLRQIDSITLQISDEISLTTMCDEVRGGSNFATILQGGLLSGTLVTGFSRTPKVTDMYFQFWEIVNSVNSVQNPAVQLNGIAMQFYFPRYFTGAPLQGPWWGESIRLGANGGNAINNLNSADAEQLSANTGTASLVQFNSPIAPGKITGPSGTFWCDNLMYFADGSGKNSGVDLMGNVWSASDPDQLSGSNYHPYCQWTTDQPTGSGTGTLSGTYGGGYNVGIVNIVSGTQNPQYPPNTSGSAAFPMLAVQGPQNGYSWYPGVYQNAVSGIRVYNSGTAINSLDHIVGGINLTSFGGSGGSSISEYFPMDSLQPVSVINSSGTSLYPAIVVPLSGTFVGKSSSAQLNIELKVSDPMVNKFPGDWMKSINPATTTLNANLLNATGSTSPPQVGFAGGTNAYYGQAAYPPTAYASGTGTIAAPKLPLTTVNGDTPPGAGYPGSGYRPVTSGSGGDPLSVWAPPIDVRMPKLARFPSVGALNSIRTGIIPDAWTPGMTPSGTAAGTPWRSISFASISNTQVTGQTTKGGCYPDWVLLDLFTVPFVPQPPVISGTANPAQPPARLLTYGGATEGRLNINNPAIPYPFSLASYIAQWPQPPQRTAPMQALFYGLSACTSYGLSSNTVSGTAIWTPIISGTIAAAVQTYSGTNPFMIPGELANVPAISNFTYTNVNSNAISRNDVMRQVVGATTTQSNTYSIWVVAQTVKKNPNNSGYGTYQPGDTVTGEVRRHYLVERYIEPGTDGVPGNSLSAGTGGDGIAGTEDDVIDGNLDSSRGAIVAGRNPTLPYPIPYRWRILAVEDVAR